MKIGQYASVSLKEALKICKEYALVPYARGTNLMIEKYPSEPLLFLTMIPELKRISKKDNMLYLGAGCTFTELIKHPLVP